MFQNIFNIPRLRKKSKGVPDMFREACGAAACIEFLCGFWFYKKLTNK